MATEKENPKGEKLDLGEEVEVYGTEKAKHMGTGKAYKVHPVMAKKLIKRGFATKEPQKK